MKAEFYQGNRDKLVSRLNGGLVVLSAYTQLQRSNDAAFRFEQEANFWYLAGIEHPDWKVVIDGTAGSSWLVAPQVDSQHELFDGSLSATAASQVSGIKKVISHDEGQTLLRSLAKRHSVVYMVDQPAHAEHFNFVCNPAILDNKRQLERLFTSVRDCTKDLAELRAIKHPAEVAAIKKAVGLTVDAFERVKANFGTYKHEYEIEADFTHYFRAHGAIGHAYDPIIAAGKNACTLHYNANTEKLKAGQLVLMDVGVRHDGYSADITRTYQHGKATKRQQDVHRVVQQAHKKIISLLAPNLQVEEYSKSVDDIMKAALIELGLIRDANDEKYRTYFPHAISHGLGIDVHDSLGGPRYFESGMVLTVEPGIYIPEEGIGVRIEDDILITNTGHENLSAQLSTDL